MRTLHHYDDVSLVSPSERSEAGYRLYSAEDLDRLQQVLFYKELGFHLQEILRLMTAPNYDRRQALLTQRRLLEKRGARLQAMIRVIDKTLISMEGGVKMTDEEMFEVFGDFDPAAYEDEGKERWGESEAYRESARASRATPRRIGSALKTRARNR